jgi:hypothetical protein
MPQVFYRAKIGEGFLSWPVKPPVHDWSAGLPSQRSPFYLDKM